MNVFHRSMHTHRVVPVFLALLVACKGATPTPSKADPNAPAVEPAVIDTRPPAPVDTGSAKPKTAPRMPSDPQQRALAVSQGYALFGAMIVNGDSRMMSQLLTPDAVLSQPDSVVHGMPAVAAYWANLGRARALADFRRTSNTLRVVDDSTVADTGSYVMVMKRTPKDSVLARGTYATEWRTAVDPSQWRIAVDRIHPADGTKSSKR